MEDKRKFSRLFTLNLVVIVALGVGVSGWILRYTDWFPVVGGLLTLGGLFSWLAFVSKVLPEDVLKELQWSLYGAIFDRNFTLVLLVILISALFALGSHLGTIEIRSFDQIVTSRPFSLTYPDGTVDGPNAFDAGGSSRSLLRASLWSPTEYKVKVSGYPSIKVRLFGWSKISLFVPQSFSRPVPFIQPTVEFLRVLGENTVHLIVDGGDKKWEDPKYDGYAFWLTCEEDLRISSEKLLEMRSELANSPRLESRRFSPRSRGVNCEELRGPKFKLITLKEDDKPFTVAQDFEFSEANAGKDFVQVVPLEYIKKDP